MLLLLFFNSFINLYNRDKKFDIVLLVFDRIQQSSLQLDEVAFSCALRAAYQHRSWKETMSLLNEAYDALEKNKTLSIFHTTLTNLNYGDASTTDDDIRYRYDQLRDWLTEKSILPTPQTFVSIHI